VVNNVSEEHIVYLKMEAVVFSKMLITPYQITGEYSSKRLQKIIQNILAIYGDDNGSVRLPGVYRVVFRCDEGVRG
jgi:hypothetical protein